MHYNKPVIFDIKGNSLEDGPGIRSVIFLKGCPLDCFWCHNPESKCPKPALSFEHDICINCGECISICKNNALSFNDQIKLNRDKCSLCFKCTHSCPTKALSKSGDYIEPIELIEKLRPYFRFYKTSNGGVTISGGEATLYPEYLSELLYLFKKENINILLQTSGHFNFDKFTKLVLPYLDEIYFDIKFISNQMHKKYCGVSNELILSNFIKLVNLLKNHNFKLLARTPLIPNITDTEENILNIIDFYKENAIIKGALLPNNPIWNSKQSNFNINTNKKFYNSEMNKLYDTNKFNKIKRRFESNNIEII